MSRICQIGKFMIFMVSSMRTSYFALLVQKDHLIGREPQTRRSRECRRSTRRRRAALTTFRP